MSKRFKDADRRSPMSKVWHKESLADLGYDPWDDGGEIVEQEIIGLFPPTES